VIENSDKLNNVFSRYTDSETRNTMNRHSIKTGSKLINHFLETSY